MAVTTRVRAATLADRVRAEIRAELARRGVTQADLARDLVRPAMWVSDRLRGAVTLTLDDLDAIAEALDVDAVTFLEAAGSEPAPPRRRGRRGDTETYPAPPVTRVTPTPGRAMNSRRPSDLRPVGRASGSARPNGSRRTSRVGLKGPALTVRGYAQTVKGAGCHDG
jgi:transcriptional regulator with XRE-family HTH domain